jgi:hypothetical protein
MSIAERLARTLCHCGVARVAGGLAITIDKRDVTGGGDQ